MKKLIYILFFCACISLKAQPPSKWYAKFGGNGVDVAYGVKETFQKKYIAIGSTSSIGSGAVDAYLILVDSMGQKIWERTFGGALSDVGKRVVTNPSDSGFIFTGFTSSMGSGGYDVYVVRTDKNGNLVWQRTFGGLDWDFGTDIVMAPDGNVVICGSTYSKGYGKKDAYLLKVNSNTGSLIWEKYYGGVNDDEFKALKIVSSNSIIVATGKTASYNDIKGDIYFLKMGINGDSILFRSYGLPNKEDFGSSIVENPPFNSYIIAGGSESYSTWGKDAFIFSVSNSTGDSLWLQHYGNANLDQEATSVVLNSSNTGTYVISYSDIDFATFKKDIKHLCLDAIGIYISGNSLGLVEDEELYHLSNTSDKGYIGVGYTKSLGSIDQDFFIAKFDSAAYSTGSVVGIQENTTNFKLNIRVYPTVLDRENSKVIIENYTQSPIKIFDVLGKEIDLRIYSSTNRTELDLELLPRGIYFLELSQKGQRQCTKLIKK